jgi:hypothetical protein
VPPELENRAIALGRKMPLLLGLRPGGCCLVHPAPARLEMMSGKSKAAI